jgi:hypothetical protein
VAARLVAGAVARVRGERRGQVQLKTTTPLVAGAVPGLVGVPFGLTYALELPEDVEHLRLGKGQYYKRIKWAVSKAQRMGVRVRAAESEAELRAWYGLHAETMRWHVVPPRPYRFFELVWRYLRPLGMARLLLAEQHGAGGTRLLAGSLFFQFGTTVSYAFNGRRYQDLGLHPNDAILYSAIHDACREGFRRCDFGEVENNRGLAVFKEKWGAEPRPVYRYYYPALRGLDRLQVRRLEKNDLTYRATATVWRHLPISVTKLAGDLIHKHM